MKSLAMDRLEPPATADIISNTFETVSYPGEPEEAILAWTAVDGDVLAGTNDGRIIHHDLDGTWTDARQVPAGIRSLCS